MPGQADFDAMVDKIDEENNKLRQVIVGSASPAQKQTALEASKRLSKLKIKLIQLKREARADAFDQVAALLRREAEALGANPFKDAFDRIGELVGIVTGTAEPAQPVPEGNDASEAPIRDLVDNVIGQADELIDRPSPPRDPANTEITPPTGEKGQIIAAIKRSADKHGESAGLLGAVAFVESSFRNVDSDRSSAKGPFQFIEPTWKGLVERFGAQTGFTVADHTNIEAQAEMAARSFLSYRQALKDLRPKPEHAELYLCHFLGPGAARACVQDDPSRPIDQSLRAFYANKTQGAGFADKIMAGNPQLKTKGRVRTIQEVLDHYAARLLDGEARFQRLLALQAGSAPEPAPSQPAESEEVGVPRWLAIAQQEQAKGIREFSGNGHNPQILKYIASTTIASDPDAMKDETPWCSAFVNWCVTQSGLRGTNSARARDWHDNGGWGREIGEPVKGCIVVLWREDPSTGKGHVGFFDHMEADRIFLLGGNQSDTINIAGYDRNRLLSYRMSS